MEAKDTVMDYDGKEVGIILREFLNEAISDALVDKLLQAQAEISFRAGIREVVEWIDEQDHELFRTGYINKPEVWQAKLREWGVDKPKRCPHQNTTIIDDKKYCADCGEEIEGAP